ncbi:MAG: peptidyl-prolyl cis-trans isomerase [Gammaproteobacteria bacterium]|nr:peptidyl-prolyl cis-trans isomerase [Gammaproteobacteria bacterium]
MRKLLLTFTSLLLLISSVNAADDITKKQVKLETSLGDITLELDLTRAPVTVLNFLKYVRSGHYDGTIFHRVIKEFMIQGGGFTPEFVRKEPDATIKNEAANGLKNVRGSIAMARTNDPHSASTQFFINVVDNSFLDHTDKNSPRGWGYAVFGHVIKGMNVVDKIRNVRTGSAGPFPANAPVKTVLIHKATIIGEKPVSTKKK